MTDWQTLTDHGIDPDNRVVWIQGDIDEEVSSRVCRTLMALAQESSEAIVLIISSGGGNLADAFAIVDTMRWLAAPVGTVAIGSCQSAALLVLVAGKPGMRTVSRHCQLMHHGTSLEVGGTIEECRRYIDSVEVLSDRADALLDECTGVSPGYWRGLSTDRHDHHITAERAVTLGLADRILGEKE